MYQQIIRPLLFGLEAEKAHYLGLSLLKFVDRFPGAKALMGQRFEVSDPRLCVKVMGLSFPNPVGLAAGFAKNGELAHLWKNLGFGFCEIGTITAKAQRGNPKPRIFRLQEDRAIINRLGFNNWGAHAIACDLEKSFSRRGRPKIPLGINIGKSKDTPIDEATNDYLFSFQKLNPYGDYFVINVSSPNTPGLRDLQNKDALKNLMGALMEDARPPKPLLVKLAPDLSNEELDVLVDLFLEMGISGVILTNTTLERCQLQSALSQETGGLSGKPLEKRSTAMIRRVHERAGDRLVIMGCGGIFCAEDAFEKIQAGASLVQIYTGFVYEGPSLPKKINKGLLKLMD
jgi:dihydroorotate dehydrogenase